jgi:hypothetical protein
MIIKEFTCSGGHEFEALVPVCPYCGQQGKRAFRTAPGISKGIARRRDSILEGELKARGITNIYSNRYGPAKVTYKEEPYSTVSGMVRASWGTGALDGYMTANGTPLSVPQVSSQPLVARAGERIGRGNQALLNKTQIVARTDSRGNQVKG